MAANMGALAESFGLRQGLKYRGDIKDALLDRAAARSSLSAGLGGPCARPLVLQGARGCSAAAEKSRKSTCARSLTYAPESTASRFFLAETLLERGRREEARAELQRVLDAPFDPDWAPEDRDFKARARALLDTLGARPAG